MLTEKTDMVIKEIHEMIILIDDYIGKLYLDYMIPGIKSIGSGYGSDRNADRLIAVIARDTGSTFYGVLRHKSLGNTEFQGFFHGFGFGYSWVQFKLPR